MTVHDRKERERQARERAIVAAARRIAESEGWDAVTTRRLAAEIEYSQPVLYGHFENRNAIIAAAALEGFSELAGEVRLARTSAPDRVAALRAVARAYDSFAARVPALYDAMFTMRTDLAFAVADAPAPLRTAFDELCAAIAPFTPDGTRPETVAEVFWSALHGLSTLDRGRRFEPGRQDERLSLLVSLFLGHAQG